MGTTYHAIITPNPEAEQEAADYAESIVTVNRMELTFTIGADARLGGGGLPVAGIRATPENVIAYTLADLHLAGRMDAKFKRVDPVTGEAVG